jgi:phytoene synthase
MIGLNSLTTQHFRKQLNRLGSGHKNLVSFIDFNSHQLPSSQISSSSRRNFTILNRALIDSDPSISSDLDHAISTVRTFDPSGYLPGLLLRSNDARVGYFAMRSFWIESGLRFKKNPLKNDFSSSKQISGVGQRHIMIPDQERVKFWKNGVDAVFNGSNGDVPMQDNTTLRLLREILKKHSLPRKHFDSIIEGREMDVNMKQYPTIMSLEKHVDMSCGSLLQLVLECGGIHDNCPENELIFEAAREVGIAHGLTNALRTSVPTASATGKVIIPQELCTKHGIESPRYLLSALGMGDEKCKRHMQDAVKDIVQIARDHLEQARKKREEISKHPLGDIATSAFLPALASETFLDRLENHQFDLTNRALRNVSQIEHMQCAQRLLVGSWNKTF